MVRLKRFPYNGSPVMICCKGELRDGLGFARWLAEFAKCGLARFPFLRRIFGHFIEHV